MATPELRNGVRTHIPTLAAGLSPVIATDREDQLAAALGYQWWDVPLRPDDVNGATGSWVFTYPAKAASPAVWTHTYGATSEGLFLWLAGHSLWRGALDGGGAGTPVEVLGARIKTGGNFNGGTIDILEWSVNFEASATPPGNATALANIAIASNNVFQGTQTFSVDWTGAPKVLDSNDQYCIKVTPPAGGVITLWGVQLMTRHPKLYTTPTAP